MDGGQTAIRMNLLYHFAIFLTEQLHQVNQAHNHEKEINID